MVIFVITVLSLVFKSIITVISEAMAHRKAGVGNDVNVKSANDVIEVGLLSFSQQLLNHCQFGMCKSFLSGSSVEIEENTGCISKYQVCNNNTDVKRVRNLEPSTLIDIDIMGYSTAMYAFPCGQPVPETYCGTVIRIYTDNIHVGYCRLIKEDSDEELTLRELIDHKEADRHGPAVTFQREAYIEMIDTYSLGDTNITRESLDADSNICASQDRVAAVHCPYWPTEALEWITRQRPHGFPPKSLIMQIARYGCDFVQVSHKSRRSHLCSEIDLKHWRFSFSKAEVAIIHSWTTSQRIVYRTLWGLHKILNISIEIVGMCTYYFKTLMLWACENRSLAYWAKTNLLNAVFELGLEMTQWMKAKCCRNYFIPDNNMMDHLSDTDLSQGIDVLCQMLRHKEFVSDVLNSCTTRELFTASSLFCFKFPTWIKDSFLIHNQIEYKKFNRVLLQKSHDASRTLCGAFTNELSAIFQGLSCQQKAANLQQCAGDYIKTNNTSVDDQTNNAEIHLKRATAIHKTSDRDVLYCDRSSSQCVLESWFVECPERNDNETRQTGESTESTDMKHLLYCRSEEDIENDEVTKKSRTIEICNDRKAAPITDNVIVDLRITDNEQKTCDVKYKFISGAAPTVSVSWFIAEAYLANYYYTAQRDNSSALHKCNEIIRVYRDSRANQLFAERTFPVVFTTRWTLIYDREIQEMIGFYSLCQFLFNITGRGRSVYIGVCPVLFAMYLKIRCLCDQVLLEDEADETLATMERFVEEEFEHLNQCESDWFVNNARYTLCAAQNNVISNNFSDEKIDESA